jgi:thiamine-phosphate pyrophosphorylase
MAIVSTAAAGLEAAPKATILQLRDPAATARKLEAEAHALVGKSSVPVLISSRCDIAIASGAAGVNLPERDLSVAAARSLLGQKLIGRSVHSLDAALRAEQEGADFVIFGPVWPTPSHRESQPAGVEALARVARALRIPVLAVGGVTRERVAECEAAGAAGYAAIRLFSPSIRFGQENE